MLMPVISATRCRVCVCGSSCHMPRKEEGSAHKRTKPLAALKPHLQELVIHQFPRRRLPYGRDLLNQKMNRVHFHPHLRGVRHRNLQQQPILNKQFSQLRNHKHFKLNLNKGISQLRGHNHHSQKNQLYKNLLVLRKEW